MTLAEAMVGSRLKVVGRTAPRCGCGDSLAGLGIHVGDFLKVLRAAPFGGPVMVEVKSSGVRVALGRGMAEAVVVEPADAPA